MKQAIKKITPKWLLSWYRKRKSKFRNKTTSEVFTEIYQTNHWQSSESFSGPGSELNHTKILRKALEEILSDMKITSVLDIPCGDFTWMQEVDLSKVEYIGADIVEELIENNNKKHTFNFTVLNLIKDPLPKSDIIIVRDCLGHLSYADISAAIKNIKSSGCKYLFTTTFPDRNLNNSIVSGQWSPINLQAKPFNFPSPQLIINENCTESDGAYKDKSMALWEISKI